MIYLILLLSTLLLIKASIYLVNYLKEQLKDTTPLVQNILIALFIIGLMLLIGLPVHEFLTAQQRLNELSSSQSGFIFISNLSLISTLALLNASLARAIFRKKYKATATKWLKTTVNMLVLTTNLFFWGVLIYQYVDTKKQLEEMEEHQSQTKQK